jgi:branched-chain amino acid transport system ATP-binding protein
VKAEIKQEKKRMILEAQNISKYYGGFCALEDVSITINEGEFVSLIGPNGAGKTTLINVLTGLLKPEKGRVLFKGKNIAGMDCETLTKLGIARSFQLIHIFPELTVLDAIKVAVISRQDKGLKFYRSLTKDNQLHEEALEVAGLFGLTDQIQEKAKNLPQGAKKLLDVASAFALHPEIILLDEPTSGVSTSNKHKIMQVLVEASKKIGINTVLQVEHDMDIVFSYSDRIIAIQQAKILADGIPDEIAKNEDVISAVVGRKESFKTFQNIMETEAEQGA